MPEARATSVERYWVFILKAEKQQILWSNVEREIAVEFWILQERRAWRYHGGIGEKEQKETRQEQRSE
jgi:hypothetical protein